VLQRLDLNNVIIIIIIIIIIIMEEHIGLLETLCRICGKKTKGNEWTEKVAKYANEIKQIWDLSVLVDSPSVHPRFICMKCRVECSSKDYVAGKFKSSQKAKLWSPHNDDCATCKRKVARGRSSKRKRVELAKKEGKHLHGSCSDRLGLRTRGLSNAS